MPQDQNLSAIDFLQKNITRDQSCGETTYGSFPETKISAERTLYETKTNSSKTLQDIVKGRVVETMLGKVCE